MKNVRLSFSEEDMRQLPNTVSITKQVGESHPNLGARVAFLKTCDCADMGIIEVGDPGIGKSASLWAVMHMAHRKLFQKKFTLAAIQKYNDFFSNSETTWVCLELSDLSEIVAENMFRVVGDLLTENSAEIGTKYYEVIITNAQISFMAACNYELYNKMLLNPLMRSYFRDRLMPLFVFSVKEKRINTTHPQPKITMNFPPPENVKIDTGLFEDIVAVLRSRFSRARAFEYATRLLQGSAALNHRKVATDADAKFILLFAHNIEAERWASTRESLSSALRIDIDALKLFSEAVHENGICMPKLAKRETLEGGITSLVRTVYRYPNLFRRVNDWVFANPKIIAECIAPQLRFERVCVNEGMKYY